MNKTELIVIVAIILFFTFLLGWLLSWAYARLNNKHPVEVSEIDNLAQRLHEAEEARDQSMTYIQQREYELTNQLTQAEAELSAAMEGLGAARREVGDLQSQLEAFQSKASQRKS